MAKYAGLIENMCFTTYITTGILLIACNASSWFEAETK